MGVDVASLQFYSGHPIDKIVATGTQTIVNDGNTTNTGTGDGDDRSRITTTTIANPYGKECFVRFVWSIDGTNFNAAEAHLTFTYKITLTNIPVTSPPIRGLRAAASIGVDATNITFLTGNGFHGNVSRLSSDAGNVGYTPTSQTFTIKYALYEILPYGD